MHQLKTAPHGLGMDGVDVDDLSGADLVQACLPTGVRVNNPGVSVVCSGGVPLMVEKSGRGLPMADPMRRG